MLQLCIFRITAVVAHTWLNRPVLHPPSEAAPGWRWAARDRRAHGAVDPHRVREQRVGQTLEEVASSEEIKTHMRETTSLSPGPRPGFPPGPDTVTEHCHQVFSASYVLGSKLWLQSWCFHVLGSRVL